jgi:integrase
VKRSARAGVEDRWHRPPRRGEQVPYPTDHPSSGSWCVDPKHGTPGTQVTTARHAQGKRWMARWVDHDGNERTKAFDRKAEAQNHIGSVTTALSTGTYADPKRASVTFGVVAEQWFTVKAQNRSALRRLKPKTLVGYRRLLDVVVLPKWRDVKLKDIDHDAIQAWVWWLATDPAARQRAPKRTEVDDAPAGLSAARVIQSFQVVDQVLAFAVRKHYIAANPADGVEQPRKSSREDVSLSHDQVRRLAEARAEIRAMVYVLAYGGMRYGELAATRVGDVDLTRRRIRVSRSVTYVTGDGHVEDDTKTHQDRIVPILTEFLADILADVIADRDPCEYLFPHHDGGPIPLDWFRWRFDKAAEHMCMTGISPKTLRHTAGSLALGAGASVVTVQKLLGHRSPMTTMNVYSHMLPDDFDNLAKAMNKAARVAG